MNAWTAAATALLLAAAAAQTDSLANPAGMDPSCKGHEDALGMMVQLGYVDAKAAMRPPALAGRQQALNYVK